MENLSLGIGSRVKHKDFGMGVVIQIWSDSYEITFIDHGTKSILKSDDILEIVDYRAPEVDMLSFEKVERLFVKTLRRFSDIQETVDIAPRWLGGQIIFEPSDKSLKSKEMPIEKFFHKIVMVRDRLRVMEQRINSSKLNEDEKVNLQQYITRIYGSLTSFNILFAEKDDYFRGESS